MARAKEAIEPEEPLYERDFYRWVEMQARLLKEGDLERLDVVNLVEEIEDLGIGAKNAVKSNLVVVLAASFEAPVPTATAQPELAGEHRRAPPTPARRSPQVSPSLRGHARGVFAEAYADARALAIAETGLAERTFPPLPPYTLEQTLDPGFLPD